MEQVYLHLLWIHPDKFWIEVLGLILTIETILVIVYFVNRWTTKR